MPTETDKLKIKLIQPTDMFADDTFNEVIKDVDNKVVGIAHLTSGAHWEVWTKNTDHAKGDIVRTPYLKSNQYLECTSAGKTGTDCPNDNIPGTMITDNTAKWIIRVLGAVDESTISIWIGGEEYGRGSLVLYNNKLYRCKVSHTATTFDADASKWQEVFASLQEWRATFYYALNDIVLYNGKLFKCILANDDTVFDSNKWSLINNLSIVHPYEQNTNYMEGQLATVNGKLYRSKTTHLSPTGNFTDDKINWENIYSDIVRWNKNVNYYVGDIVSFDDVMYICKIAHTSSSISFKSDKDNWNIYHTPSSFIKDWVANTIYESEQVVRYKKRIYRCKVKNDDSSWNESNWELINLDIEDWVASTNYYVGQYVSYNGTLYRCITANSDSTWTGSNWKKVSGGGIDNWVTGASYSVDDLVIYADKLYQCTTAHTSTTFSADEANWKEISSYTIHIDDWVANTSYSKGDIIFKDGVAYRAKNDYTSAAQMSSEDSSLDFVFANVREWATNTYYRLGSIVKHNGALYECLASHTSTTTFGNEEVYTGTSGIYNNSYPNSPGSSRSVYTIDIGKLANLYKISGKFVIDKHLWRDIKVEVSTDNSVFTDVGTMHCGASGGSTVVTMVFNNMVQGRYVKLTASNFSWWGDTPREFSIDDLQIFALDDRWKLLSGYPQWQASTEYTTADIVTYGGDIYKCIKGNSDSTFDITKWKNITASDGGIGVWKALKYYAVDDTVIFGSKIYRCTVAHTSSTFASDINKWTEVSPTTIENWQASITYPVDSIVLYDNSTGISPWAGNTSYAINDKVVYDNRIYECLVANSDSDFTASKWHQVATAQVNLYKCITANNDANFTPSKWLAVSSIGLASIEDIEAMF